MQAACSTSRRTTLATASRPRITRPSPSLSALARLTPPQAPAPPPAARGAALGLRRQRVPQHRQCRTTRKGQNSSRRGPATARRQRRQLWSWRRCHPRAGRRAYAIQDFKTSARSSHRPSSPRQEGMLTLNSFMIPYPKLCDMPSDIAGGLAMISWSIS